MYILTLDIYNVLMGNNDWLGMVIPENQKVDLVSSSPAVGAQVFLSRSRNSLDRFTLLGYRLDSLRFKAATSIVVASVSCTVGSAWGFGWRHRNGNDHTVRFHGGLEAISYGDSC
jgi:hypothetical protein